MRLLAARFKIAPAIVYCPNAVLPMNELSTALSSQRPNGVRRLAQSQRAFPTDVMDHHGALSEHQRARIIRTNRHAAVSTNVLHRERNGEETQNSNCR